MPANVELPDVLKRFLNHLIEELDVVLGFRGDAAYVKQSDLTGSVTTIAELVDTLALTNEQVQELTESIETLVASVATNTDAVDTINTLLASSTLSSTYHDFDDAAYATLAGNNEFSTLGSNLSNAPYSPVGGETYYNYINSVVTANGGVVQTLRAYSTSTLAPTTYFRIGDTFIDAVGLGWT